MTNVSSVKLLTQVSRAIRNEADTLYEEAQKLPVTSEYRKTLTDISDSMHRMAVRILLIEPSDIEDEVPSA